MVIAIFALSCNNNGNQSSNTEQPAATETPDATDALTLQENLTKMTWTASTFSGFAENNKSFGETNPEITFSADGKIMGKFCNSMSGNYEITDDKLKIIDLVSTKMMCEGNLMKAEDFFKENLFEVDITKGVLTLVNSKGEILTFTRATTATENPMAN